MDRKEDAKPELKRYKDPKKQKAECERVRKLMDNLINSGRFSREKVYEQAGIGIGEHAITEKAYNNFQCGRKGTSIPTLKKIEDFCELHSRNAIPTDLGTARHPLYGVLLGYLKVRESNESETRERASGIYRFARGSYLFPERLAGIIVGYLRVYDDNGIVCVEEFQQHDERYGVRSVAEEREGYIFYKSNKFYILTTEKHKPEHLQMTILDESAKDTTHVYHLRGVTFGTALHLATFTSRVVMERVSDDVKAETFAEFKKTSRIHLVKEIERHIEQHGQEAEGLECAAFLELIRKEKARNDVITIW
jgi:hypothetical protein